MKQKICLSVNMEFSLHDFGGQRLKRHRTNCCMRDGRKFYLFREPEYYEHQGQLKIVRCYTETCFCRLTSWEKASTQTYSPWQRLLWRMFGTSSSKELCWTRPLKMQGAGLAPLISIAHFLPPRTHASLPNHCMPEKSPDLRRTETTSFLHAPHQAHHTLQTECATEVQERRFTAYSSCSKFSSVLSPSPAAFPSITA